MPIADAGFAHDPLQFYPTPKALAKKMWGLFKNPVSLVLEPSAGDGDLASVEAEFRGRTYERDSSSIHVIEIDPRHYDALNGKGFTIVGDDFLRFSDASIYSHFILNPPFNQGAKHLLHAWEIAWDAEIVALLNAETLRNPSDRHAQKVVELVEKYGFVEEVAGAFMGPDVLREAQVDTVIVYLRKDAGEDLGFLDHAVDKMETDNHEGFGDEQAQQNEVGLPLSYVQSMVAAFDRAVASARALSIEEERYGNIAQSLGRSLAEFQAEREQAVELQKAMKEGRPPRTVAQTKSITAARKAYGKRYIELKERAWLNVLNSTGVQERLSQRAYQKLLRSFESIQVKAFTAANIYGFLESLALSGKDIHIETLCHIFDSIVSRAWENAGFYNGWSSNSQHRFGMKLRPKRFILDGYSSDSYQRSLYQHETDFLRDMDLAFAMLDGKRKPEVGVQELLLNEHTFRELRTHGERLASSYFEIRYYATRGTIHFFPTKPELIDRLNLMVGRHRQWLPEDYAQASDTFWKHYEESSDTKMANKVAKAFQERAAKAPGARWNALDIRDVVGLHNAERAENARAIMDEVVPEVVAELGYDPQELLGGKDTPRPIREETQLLLLEAS